ncbi:MAG: hypothetical protein ABEI06_07845 [Halobacteriaceae archaeon]
MSKDSDTVDKAMSRIHEYLEKAEKEASGGTEQIAQKAQKIAEDLEEHVKELRKSS